MGHMYVGITTKLSNIVPDLVKRANLPAGTALAIYEEIKPNMLEKVEDLDKPLEHVLEELMDGDILVFQKKTADANYRYGEKSWCFLGCACVSAASRILSSILCQSSTFHSWINQRNSL